MATGHSSPDGESQKLLMHVHKYEYYELGSQFQVVTRVFTVLRLQFI